MVIRIKSFIFCCLQFSHDLIEHVIKLINFFHLCCILRDNLIKELIHILKFLKGGLFVGFQFKCCQILLSFIDFFINFFKIFSFIYFYYFLQFFFHFLLLFHFLQFSLLHKQFPQNFHSFIHRFSCCVSAQMQSDFIFI